MLNTINVASSGLAAAREQVENVMNNIANENTPGYKKRVVGLEESSHVDARLTGRGVEIGDTTRVTNVYMFDNLTSSVSKQSQYDELSTMLADIESIFYETEDSGFSADLDRYFQSLEDLRANPDNEIYKNNLRNAGTIIVDDLKTLYSGIEQREVATKNTLINEVEEVNSLLNDIGTVNYQMLTSGSSNDLLDKRDQLEQELAKYIDIEIDRSLNYELSISGTTAVRFENNIHSLNIVTEEIPQKDMYADIQADGSRTSSLVDSANWDDTDKAAEIQTVRVTGDATGQVNFLGTLVPSSASGDTAEATIDYIITDKANIISNWNSAYPNREIADIVKSSSSELQITFVNTEGDVDSLSQSLSEGIDFAQGVETTKGVLDSLTYTLNNEFSITIHHGDTITNVPIGTDPETYETITVDKDNIVRALVAKINSDPDMSSQITAYNGQYVIDSNGDKVLTNSSDHPDYDAGDANKDRYLIIESNIDGDKGKFSGRIVVKDEVDATITGGESVEVTKNSIISVEGTDDIHLEIFDKELTVKSGTLNPMLNNLNTTSTSNYFTQYKEELDQFAAALSDISSSYVETSDGEYIYGKSAVDVSLEGYRDQRVDLALFTGSSVDSLQFNEGVVATLNQDNLDYLAKLQWKTDIVIDGTDTKGTSFSKFYQSLKISISDNKENIDFQKETQDAVTESLQLTYDKLTKVDKDEEMMNLIKYQAAYEANAKLITIIDEMLATILGMTR
ncbi:MAG: hypothetical protein KAQ94_05085 [Arcobacteraceae bacterium]|nr:hypothetical protein [Arcobacteraceae bacterium]